MAKGRKKKFALVWWANCGSTSVVDWASIPGKREVGTTVNLLWKTAEGKTMRLPAKILAIDTEKDVLEKMIVTSSGELHETGQKIFSTSVLQQKKEKAQELKVLKNVKKLHKNDLSKRILQEKPLYSNFSNSSLPSVPTPTMTRGECDASYSKTNVTSTNPVTDIIPGTSRKNIDSHGTAVDYDSFDDMLHLTTLAQTITGPLCTTQSKISTESNISQELQNSSSDRSKELLLNLDDDEGNTISQKLPIVPDDYNRNAEIQNDDSPTPSSSTNNFDNNSHNNGNNKSPRGLDRPVHAQEKKNLLTQPDITDDQTTNMSEDSDDGVSDEENNDGPVRAMAGMMNWEVTERDIAHQELLLKAMRYVFEISQKNNIESKGKLQMDPVHLEPSEHMEEISPNSKFYLSKAKIIIINTQITHIESDEERWKALVREVLIEVYGTSLRNYSARGLRGGRPAIDHRLFKGLYEWVKRVCPTVDKKRFIIEINKLAYNKRKSHRNRLNLQAKRKKTD